MYSLVQFIGDFEYEIYKTCEIKTKNGKSVAKWKGVYYEANLIGSSNSKIVLLDVQKKLISEKHSSTSNKDCCNPNITDDRADDLSTVQCSSASDNQLTPDQLCEEEQHFCTSNNDWSSNPNITDELSTVQCSSASDNQLIPDQICEEEQHFCTSNDWSNPNITDELSTVHCSSASDNQLTPDRICEEVSEHDPFSTDEDSSFRPSSTDDTISTTGSATIEDFMNDLQADSSVREELESQMPVQETLDLDELDIAIGEIDEMEVVGKKKRVAKKHYCLYCRSKQTNLPRHLERIHCNEELVQQALTFKSGSKERIKMFSNIRKEGDFQNRNEDLITVGKSLKSENTSFIPCPYCKGFYSKKNLKNHVRLICKTDETKRRNILSRSKVVGAKIHPTACDKLINDIFPSMRNDEIFYIATTDPTIVLYGNMLVLKYSSSSHHDKMITQQLRHIANIFLTISKLNPLIQNVEDMFDPKFYNNMVESIHKLAGLSNGKYKSPSVANHSCTLLMHLLHFIKCESIKRNDADLRKKVEDYTYLMQHSQSALITKIAGENRTQLQRSKVEILPTTEEIKKLNDLLMESIQNHSIILNQQFDFNSWGILSESVLVHIMIFNRKRPGDVERTRLIEYKNIKMINNHEINELTAEQKQQAANFGRYISRGKLNRPASTLVSKENMNAIELLLKYRSEAGVHADNEYLFANPKGNKHTYIKADMCLKSFCKKKGLCETKFTATKLRKHLATTTSSLPQEDQHRISDFMGHAFDIHNNIYKQRQAQTDILTIGKVLMNATGTVTKNTITSQLTDNATFEESILQDKELTIIEEERDSLQNIDLSISEDEDERSHTVQKRKRKSRIKVVPKSCLKRCRKTWRTPERKLIRDVFEKSIEEKRVPTLHECQNIIYENSGILSRSPSQVRSWIIAEIKRREKYEHCGSPGWSTPAKQACRTYFKNYYVTQEYPPLAELLLAKEQVAELAHKSPAVIKSHLQHDYKYMQKNSSR